MLQGWFPKISLERCFKAEQFEPNFGFCLGSLRNDMNEWFWNWVSLTNWNSACFFAGFRSTLVLHWMNVVFFWTSRWWCFWCVNSLGNLWEITPRKMITLHETNIAPENGWLEYYVPFGARPIFRCELLVSRRVSRLVTYPNALEFTSFYHGWGVGIWTHLLMELASWNTKGPS